MIYFLLILTIVSFYINVGLIVFLNKKNKLEILKIMTIMNTQKKRQYINKNKEDIKDIQVSSLLWPLLILKKARVKIAKK